MPPARVLIIGATHIGQILAQLVKLAGYEVIVIDPRTAFAAEARFPGIRLDTEWPQDTIPKIGLDPYTAVVALAHVGHIDDEALKLAMRSQCFYVGALGSRRNHAKRKQRLKEAGFSDAEIARIHSPIGINIGAQSPPEIAIAIMAQVVLRAARRESFQARLTRRRHWYATLPGWGEAMLEAYIYSGLRTPFGRHSGTLARVRPDDLLAGVVKEVVARSGFAVETIDDVSVGCASQAGEDSRNVARHALLLAGLPVETPGAVHNRLCGSGLNALVGAAHAITCGEADVCVAGGVESMTRAPFVVGKAEQAFAKDFRVFNSSLGARFPNPKIESLFGADTMPETADNLAREHQLSREECDLFALQLAAEVRHGHQGRLLPERAPRRRIPQGKGKPDLTVADDEHPRPETTMDTLLKLRPAVRAGRDHGRQRLGHQRRRRGA